MSSRLTPEQMRQAEQARAFFVLAPPEVEIEDPDYGFDREEFIDRHRSGTVRIVASGHRCAKHEVTP